MTYKEAIKRIREIRIAAIVYTFDVAEKAIEKQIPKKPLPDNKYLEGICPACGVHFLDKLTKYCGNCGQALDWSDENDN